LFSALKIFHVAISYFKVTEQQTRNWFEFYQIVDYINRLLAYVPRSVRRGTLIMPTLLLLRAALWALGLVLGSLGVFFAIISFQVPALSGNAVVLLGAALAINYFLDRGKL
jgi:hypothetical protein